MPEHILTHKLHTTETFRQATQKMKQENALNSCQKNVIDGINSRFWLFLQQVLANATSWRPSPTFGNHNVELKGFRNKNDCIRQWTLLSVHYIGGGYLEASSASTSKRLVKINPGTAFPQMVFNQPSSLSIFSLHHSPPNTLSLPSSSSPSPPPIFPSSSSDESHCWHP